MKRNRDDGSEVEVYYRVVSYGSPDSWSEPGDPAEIEIEEVYGVGDQEVSLTDAERERIEGEICEMVYAEGPSPMDDDVI